MSFKLGLTGSIGMGKSTTAAMFADEGLAVWDADSAVHRLYGPGQPGTLAIAHLFPDAVGPDGAIDRAALRRLIQADPQCLERVNAAIHPLVAQDRAMFLKTNAAADIVVLDVPLLYETGLNAACDAVAVVTAPAEVQRERVMSRATMSEAEFQMILSRQVPDARKRELADYVIHTTSLEAARQAVKDIIADIRRRIATHA